jgi:hypothetical protein
VKLNSKGCGVEFAGFGEALTRQKGATMIGQLWRGGRLGYTGQEFLSFKTVSVLHWKDNE